MRFIKWSLLVLVSLPLLAAVAVYFLPASLIPVALEEADARGLLPPDRPAIELRDLSGTLWQGRAGFGSVQVEGSELVLGELNWSIDLFSLLQRRAVATVSSQSEQLQLRADVLANEQGEVTVAGLEGRLPIATLEPWIPLLVAGDIAFVIDHLVFTPQQLLALDGVVNLEYLDWLAGDYRMALGSYLAQLTMDQRGDVRVDLFDLGATLGLNGQALVNPRNGQYQIDAQLIPRQGLAPEIAESIQWLGDADNTGRVRINRRGRL